MQARSCKPLSLGVWTSHQGALRRMGALTKLRLRKGADTSLAPPWIAGFTLAIKLRNFSR